VNAEQRREQLTPGKNYKMAVAEARDKLAWMLGYDDWQHLTENPNTYRRSGPGPNTHAAMHDAIALLRERIPEDFDEALVAGGLPLTYMSYNLGYPTANYNPQTGERTNDSIEISAARVLDQFAQLVRARRHGEHYATPVDELMAACSQFRQSQTHRERSKRGGRPRNPWACALANVLAHLPNAEAWETIPEDVVDDPIEVAGGTYEVYREAERITAIEARTGAPAGSLSRASFERHYLRAARRTRTR